MHYFISHRAAHVDYVLWCKYHGCHDSHSSHIKSSTSLKTLKWLTSPAWTSPTVLVNQHSVISQDLKQITGQGATRFRHNLACSALKLWRSSSFKIDASESDLVGKTTNGHVPSSWLCYKQVIYLSLGTNGQVAGAELLLENWHKQR